MTILMISIQLEFEFQVFILEKRNYFLSTEIQIIKKFIY